MTRCADGETLKKQLYEKQNKLEEVDLEVRTYGETAKHLFERLEQLLVAVIRLQVYLP